MNEEIVIRFLSCKTKRNLADALSVSFKILCYNLYVLSEDERYKVFSVKKKNGDERQIIAPTSGIKYIQRNLAAILLELYGDRGGVYGFVKQKNIKLNAARHLEMNSILNIDLKNFFPSINFGRVLGVFKNYPFNFNEEVSITLAQICCYHGFLPQGAPSSPIISNFVCRSLDNDLLSFANTYRVVYTRYADDITFSTKMTVFSKDVCQILENEFIPSRILTGIVESNGFSINSKKTRIAYRQNCQKVTGVKVNTKLNVDRKLVRNIRAMLHAWEKYGVENAANEYFNKYNKKHTHTGDPVDTFRKVIYGKINYLKYIREQDNKDDEVYNRIREKAKTLYPSFQLAAARNYANNSNMPVIFTEGLSDSIHLNAALDFFRKKGQFADLHLNIPESRDICMNADKLFDFCKSHENVPPLTYPYKIICLFDRDIPRINKAHEGHLYLSWGANLYSMLIPKPERANFDEISIEFLFSSDDCKRRDNEGRRLYFSKEFDPETGAHTVEKDVYCKNGKIRSSYPKIVDPVFRRSAKEDTKDASIALPKVDFASNCARGKGNFKDVSYSDFEPLFHIIEQILKN